jgi:hypothetical protein
MGTNGAVEIPFAPIAPQDRLSHVSVICDSFLTKMRALLFHRLPHLCRKASPKWPQLSLRDLSKMVRRHTEARRERVERSGFKEKHETD